jgi:hypothetical protein
MNKMRITDDRQKRSKEFRNFDKAMDKIMSVSKVHLLLSLLTTHYNSPPLKAP